MYQITTNAYFPGLELDLNTLYKTEEEADEAAYQATVDYAAKEGGNGPTLTVRRAKVYIVRTAKGRHVAETLTAACQWQGEFQGSMASVETPDGVEVDISDLDFDRDDEDGFQRDLDTVRARIKAA